MSALTRGRYRVRLAGRARDVAAAQRLRYRAFRGDARPDVQPDAAREGLDADRFDVRCTHVLVEDTRRGAGEDPVCCFRVLPLRSGCEIGGTYAAQYYELSALAGFPGRMLELGRFCVAPGRSDPEILRVAWGWISACVEREGIELIFGCSSFLGTEAEPHREAFALLSQKHLAPRRWWPRVKAPEVFRFGRRRAAGASAAAGAAADPLRALRTMPPLLRSYLAMGGWVSDHAVIDRDLGTMHVFTGLEVCKVPPARFRRLRLAGS